MTMYTNSKATVIVPTYNRAALLNRTLQSLTEQKINPLSFEVIVVDDGSHDHTFSIVKKFIGRLPVCYYYQPDLGYRVASARNLGIKYATGNIIVFVDSGMVLGSGFIEAHLRAHQLLDAPVVIGQMLGLEYVGQKFEHNRLKQLLDGMNIDSAIKYFLNNSFFGDIRKPLFDLCKFDLNSLPAPWALFWSGNASVHRKTIEQYGKFDTNFDLHWGMEDIEFAYRFYRKGCRFKYLPEAVAIHFPHESDDERKAVDEHRNKKYFHQKYSTAATKEMLESDTLHLNMRLIEQKAKLA